MNIEDLTIGQARELAALFGQTQKKKGDHPFLGKYVVVRTYSAGVHFGSLVDADGPEVILQNARRLWSWSGALSLSEVATSGIASGKVSAVVPEIALTGAIEIIPTTLEGRRCLENYAPFKA